MIDIFVTGSGICFRMLDTRDRIHIRGIGVNLNCMHSHPCTLYQHLSVNDFLVLQFNSKILKKNNGYALPIQIVG